MHTMVKTNRLYGQAVAPAFVFDELSGVQVRADTLRPYRSHGAKVHHVGPVTPDTFLALKAWVASLEHMAGRRLDAVVLCSVWRRHVPGKPTRHPEGLAADVGGVWWSPSDGVTAWEYGDRRKEAVAVEATMRMHFGTVLGPASDVRHADHWHVDTGRPVGLTVRELAQSARGQRKVEVVWLQEACSVVHNRPLVLDGVWGPKTQREVSMAIRDLGCGDKPDLTQPPTYRTFNIATALVGFGHLEALPPGAVGA